MEATKYMLESQFECAFNYITEVARELAEYEPYADDDKIQIIKRIDSALIRLETKRNLLNQAVAELKSNNWL